MRRLLILSLVIALAGCGGSGLEDLQQFVQESGKDMRGKVEPLPDVKLPEQFVYNAFELPDPFKPRKLKSEAGSVRPDQENRVKEALEAYPLENLKLMGMMQRKGVNYALILDPDGKLHYVKAGNYMGQNFGLITKITPESLTLKEIVPDGGDWVEKETVLSMPQS